MPSRKPFLGATYHKDHVSFRVWSPDAQSVQLLLGHAPPVALTRSPDGYFTADVPGIQPGAKYSFVVDGRGPLPDPASRYQPEGVHGPSAVIDPNSYIWRDQQWSNIPLEKIVLYEVHIGAFTTEGTYQSAAARLPYLKDLGITAVELMPLSDFAGDRGWGYDGVAPFAPARCYGSPDDLRSFVDQAHQLGLAVFHDVVYNHFGPDGAYQGAFSSHYFTKHHHTPWGDGLNFDDHLNQPVRDYIIESALRWVHEYHLDGLRLDATATIKDDSPRHILAELTAALGPRVHVIAEDSRNLAAIVKPESAGGYGFAGVWADDFHHHMRRTLTGDADGYFAEFDGSLPSIAATIKRGWWRGNSDTSGIPYSKFVYCIQNHDQIGNRALGDRLHQTIDWAVYRAASALLLLIPQTPLLFMGQEWGASTPFRYFTDHHAELGRAVTEGRRREFASFSGFSATEIPDPQSPETFLASKLRWDEITTEPHLYMLNLYKSLLELRRTQPDLALHIEALDDSTLLLERSTISAVIRLCGAGETKLNLGQLIWNSEDPKFAPDSQPIQVDSSIRFSRPGVVVFRKDAS